MTRCHCLLVSPALGSDFGFRISLSSKQRGLLPLINLPARAGPAAAADDDNGTHLRLPNLAEPRQGTLSLLCPLRLCKLNTYEVTSRLARGARRKRTCCAGGGGLVDPQERPQLALGRSPNPPTPKQLAQLTFSHALTTVL
ncbi:unnamed protein product [Prorocentrum cordatum]|uniref:Anaphase-promoting complex subunit 1 n=1 Tax=Prorocentrum cordatum TaxID=2364126 RepID=A0ABN9SUQ4_9DINO|nr:unnamed protein product [Polarella glacialis]